MAKDSTGIRNVREELASIDAKVMAGLMPFQRATVEHVDALFRSGRRRILVADEVGLGKTVVARGVISKIAQLGYEKNADLVKVVYICSNTTIASQNLSKLCIDKDVRLCNPSESRLSMQHIQLAKDMCDPELKQRYIQLIPLTPGTSFRLSSGQGTQYERALIYAILQYAPELQFGSRKRRLKDMLWANRVKGKCRNNWRRIVDEQVNEVKRVIADLKMIDDDELDFSYPDDLILSVKSELSGEPLTFEGILDYLDGRSSSAKKNWPEENRIISSLRGAFSKASMKMMKPDFVIMDEFQRFRSLITDDDTEMGMLARRFFGDDVRVLLLSATPFRMYSTADELGDEAFGDSNQEFNEVMGFLAGSDARSMQDFEEVWSDYSSSLLSLDLDGGQLALVDCLSKKTQAELQMRKIVSRTERVSTRELSEITRIEIDPPPLSVTESDIASYFGLCAMAQAVGASVSLAKPDYAKSCPVPLSYMRDYKLKRELVEKGGERWAAAAKVAERYARHLWIDRNEIQRYKPLTIKHARYERLRSDIFDGAHPELLLWVPPSIEYYAPSPSSPYAKARHFTKTLVFSSWAMVPPALSTLLSYEAEQRNVRTLRNRNMNEAAYRYFKQDEDDDRLSEADTAILPHGRLSLSGKKADSFCLVYPSPYLASLFKSGLYGDKLPTLSGVRADVRRVIEGDLASALGMAKVPKGRQRANTEWYAMATILLDSHLMQSDDSIAERLTSARGMAEKDYPSAKSTLSSIARRYREFDFQVQMDAIPDDLCSVLASAAIGSPAVCALRTYFGGRDMESDDYFYPFELGYSFMTKMNTAAATVCVAACMEKGKSAASTHWKHVLEYCCEGNFQAMLDEYWHLVYDDSVRRAHDSIVGPKMGNDKTPSLHKTDSRIEVETFSLYKEAACGKGGRSASKTIMRTNIAAPFMEVKGEKTKGGIRRSELRAAFNSPFRPFVLISTSVGQEGLDFHQYCRRIVHWNLPSSPIDFEQREGRINRYKSLAVRQTLSERYGDMVREASDVWEALFRVSERVENSNAETDQAESGLLPYWGVTDGGARLPIERLLYNYPFSVDESRYRYLMETTARYRAVLGQPNQEELLGLLTRRFGDTGLVGRSFEELFMNLCPFCYREGDASGIG